MVKRKKILLSAYACEPNKGSEPGVGWNWSVGLSQKYDVHVITRENNKLSIEKYMENHPNEYLHFHYYDCSWFMKKVKKLPYGIFVYYKKWQFEIYSIADTIVKTEKIDLVHHITFNEFRTPGKLYNLGVPFIWGPIGGGQYYNPHLHNAYFGKLDILSEKIRNVINNLHLKFSADIHNAVLKSSEILVADKSTLSIMPKTREYIRMLETAYDARKSFPNFGSDESKDHIDLLWVGGIWPRKGLKVLLDALGESEFRAFKLTIIGDGKDKKKCEKLSKKYCIDENVKFLGSIQYKDVCEYYAKADLFIFTSLRDTSGNVVLEAMSNGLPIICFDHHGVSDIVNDEIGIKIELKDYTQIKTDLLCAIKNYYSDEVLRTKHGKESRNRLENYYCWDANLNNLSKIYDKVLYK